jgi:hypothetical protein
MRKLGSEEVRSTCAGSTFIGAKVAGLELFTPSFQFAALQPGSPSPAKVAMLK